jgi:hypothetical protein
MKRIFIVILITLLITILFTQNSCGRIIENYQLALKPQLQWNKTWENEKCGGLIRVCVNNTNEYITGAIDTTSICAIVIKYDKDSNELWNKTWLNGSYSLVEAGSVDINGNLYVIITDDKGDHFRRYNQSGNLLWEKPLAGNSIGIKYADESIYCVGSNNSDVTITKYNLNGTIIWNRTWDGGQYEYLNVVALSSNNKTIFCAGQIGPQYGPKDTLVLAYDSNGTFLWNQSFGGLAEESGVGIGVDSANNVYVCGETESYGKGLTDILLLKYNSKGNFQWYKTWGSTNGEYVYDMAIHNDSIYLACSNQTEPLGAELSLLLKYNSTGDVQYATTWWIGNIHLAQGIDITESGDIYISGKFSRDSGSTYYIYLLKYTEVSDGAPEYTTIVLPIATVIALFLIVKLRKRRNEQCYVRSI